MKKPVHMVGSIAMGSTEEVFTRLSETLGPYLSRIPDGETGIRSRWIFFQREILSENPAIEEDDSVPNLDITEWNGNLLRSLPVFRFKKDTNLDQVHFDTGYDKAAIESYETFTSLRENGTIPRGVRFQVCLPTPYSSAYMYMSHNYYEDYQTVYERSLLSALNNIQAAIPHSDLCIQYDVCQEVLIFEDYFPHRPDDYKKQIFATLGRLGDAVSADVELGYHLCYGSPADAHLVMPKDMGILVELMNGINDAVGRKIEFLHIPVPKDRTDDAYFKPLEGLNINDGIELYLGLVHHDDESGDAARIATARKFLDDFGISTECGWGRTDPDKVPGLLHSHRKQAEGL